MKRGIRLLFGMGLLILLVSVWNLVTTDWNAIGKISDLFGWQIFWSNLVFCSVGITEMAVAYLLDQRS
jgi:hypothetical protein